ncbi:selenide, water dikinase [Desulfurivibrio alkaliphilus AHT 2]|uniref:Selenide, water dikinase n=1 Tax=Desulfurivibrio alkaliphilus (strain DSM 19089 / UNIQEM U267 / AHT2) TaxID=589865 RepID=D6Z5N8_DESAT|nr:selenide, water dikinase [Desulfurivibrio alkaliphilus AHT 2]
MPGADDPRLLAGIGGGEDAGVYRLNDETALIQTVDFFTPIVDDPYLFGQIAAANALSDVYAMGGTPLLAMNLVAFPVKKLDCSILRDILKGGLDMVTEAGALLVGGHSIEDEEIKYGLSVTGTVHPSRLLLNSGARPGDQLLLTKPIGTGVLATAIKGGLTGAGTEKLIGRVMALLNREAAQVMTSSGAHACTDITGFGLLGHLSEMAAASGVGVEIEAAAVPLLPETLHFAGMGIIPAGAHHNRQHFQQFVDCRLPDTDPREMVLYDPQTSGGLLIAAPPKSIAAMAERLHKRRYPLDFGIIGRVTDASPGRLNVI